MADQNINYKITVDVESGTASLRDLQGRIVANQVPLSELKREFGDFAKTVNAADFNKFKSGLDNTAKSHQKLQTSINQTSKASGSATSAVLELGRVVQDAPYGIRGMANNITQLVSQVSFATIAAGSFTGALRAMWTALMGPLGIVLAISAVVAALDGLYGGQKKAKDSAEETTDALTLQREELAKLTKEYEEHEKVRQKSFMTNTKEREMLKALVKESLDLTNSEERRTIALNKLNELYPKYFKNLKIDDIKGIFDAEKEVNRVLENKFKLQDALNKLEIVSNDIQLERIRLDKLQSQGKRPSLDRFDALTKEQERLRELIGIYGALDLELKEDKEKKGGKVKRDRVKALFDFPTPAEVLAYSKKLLAAVARGFGVDMKQNPLSIKPELDLTLSDDAKAKIAAYNKSVVDELMLSMKLDDFAEYSELTKQALTSISDFTNAQYERDLVTEQNKTTALNEELNQRLLNENLSKEERARIQNEIAINDEALRKKQNEIKKKQFNTQKAFNIASALVDTGRAAAGVMADAKGGFFTRLAQAIPTIAFGLAQVATIASQKFQPDAASTPIRTSGGGGSGGGMADRSFNFNLVGNNRENQLANAIQGQFNQPLKAYVVSRDMSNQQQLDANIVNSARF
jgi:hypothetical protein